MSIKKYIPTKTVSETIHLKYYGRDKKDVERVYIYVEYVWNRPSIVSVYSYDCSETCKEHYGHDDIERSIHITGEAAQKLADKFSARDENTLLRRMADRFRRYGWDAGFEIEAWLKQKGIDFTVNLY